MLGQRCSGKTSRCKAPLKASLAMSVRPATSAARQRQQCLMLNNAND